MALALDQLGGDYRIKTSLYATAKPDRRGVLKGDLILYGRGDPTINARRNGGDIFRALEPLVAALTNAGRSAHPRRFGWRREFLPRPTCTAPAGRGTT